MDSKEYQSKVISVLIQQEEIMSQLYKVYAENFHDYKDFFQCMAKDEINHANQIRMLDSKLKQGSAYFNKDRFNIEAIKSSIKFLNKTLSEAKEKILSLANAVSIAKDFETSIIEKKYFQVFEGDTLELKQTLLKLEEQQKIHILKIEELLFKITSQE
ncbi:hypothetical protein ACFLZ3_04905 [Candidatus Omnitrophota bacterium]